MRNMNGVLALSLMLLLTGCAARSAAIEPVPCVHPSVQTRTHAQLVQGLLAYHAEVERCNALNGVGNARPESN